METLAPPIVTAILLLSARIFLPRRTPRTFSPDDVEIRPAGKRTRKSLLPSHLSESVTWRFIMQAAISLIVLLVCLPFLALASAEHPWRSGAQYSIGLVVGFWLNATKDVPAPGQKMDRKTNHH